MHRSPHVIERDIEAQRRMIADAQQRLTALQHELNTARALELAQRRQQGRIGDVLGRMASGEHIVTTPRAWWIRDGQLIKQASGDDLEALLALTRHGAIETTYR